MSGHDEAVTDSPLPDGTYDVFVVDAVADPNDEQKVVRVDVTLVSGPHKGEVLTLAATGVAGSDLDVLGLPGVLTIADGAPTLAIDD